MPLPRMAFRVKLIAGLSLVVGMMLTLLGGTIFGLHAFHDSNLTLVDQLRELGASKELMQDVLRIQVPRAESPEELKELRDQTKAARLALEAYFEELRRNAINGNRADRGIDESSLAFVIDHDLVAILNDLDPANPVGNALPGTERYLKLHPEVLSELPVAKNRLDGFRIRVDRLGEGVSKLPEKLHRDFYAILLRSQEKYATSHAIVWISSIAVLGMLIALSLLLKRWVLRPVSLLHGGVIRVARGAFDHKILVDSGDEMQALAESFNDMTSKLGGMYEDLERQVNERSRQLVRSERLAGVGFLAAGVAHEINNPLASIAFCAEALENRLNSMLDPEKPDSKVIHNYTRMIQEEAFRCKSITEKLLDFSRCNDIQRERTDLVSLVQGVVEMVRHMGKYRNKQILFQPREAVLAHVDAQEIKQVVLNLVVNALDSMESNGTLRIDLRYSHGMAEMTFADNGCGMPAEVLENIFEPFFTRRKTGKGTGLGLSITHRIINQHHGEISATSPGEGLGSTFSVRLPVRGSGDSESDAPGHGTSGHRPMLAMAGEANRSRKAAF